MIQRTREEARSAAQQRSAREQHAIYREGQVYTYLQLNWSMKSLGGKGKHAVTCWRCASPAARPRVALGRCRRRFGVGARLRTRRNDPTPGNRGARR
eukprot:4498101-Pyramimonas_sp.AAC.1